MKIIYSASISNIKKFLNKRIRDYKLINILKQKIVKDTDTGDTDQDELFFLSLVSEMCKVP